MRIVKTKIYHFKELSEQVQEKVIQQFADINVDYKWWDTIYEDAKTILLKLTEFDIFCCCYCGGEFIEYADNTAQAIVKYHGKDCETHKTAQIFIAESARLLNLYPEKLDVSGYDNNETERENQQEILNNEFLKDILEDYRIILQKEYEYLASKEAIIETITINEYEFIEDGKQF